MHSYEHLKAITPFKRLVEIDNIYTMYYFEFSKDYAYPGERHDFWELVFVDSGSVGVAADSKGYLLHEGDIIFHKPNEFHSIWSNGETAPNVMVISFECKSEVMAHFEEKIMKLTYVEREMLANIIREARKVFRKELGGIFRDEYRLKEQLIGAEQMMYLHLEQFLICLLRNETEGIRSERISKDVRKHFEKKLVNDIVGYLQENLDKQLYLEDICKCFFISKTYLKTLFKKETEYSVIQYFRILKIEEAKKKIREKKGTFTEISQELGFESVHYFSRCFKQITDLTPSEYARSIVALQEEMLTKKEE